MRNQDNWTNFANYMRRMQHRVHSPEESNEIMQRTERQVQQIISRFTSRPTAVPVICSPSDERQQLSTGTSQEPQLNIRPFRDVSMSELSMVKPASLGMRGYGMYWQPAVLQPPPTPQMGHRLRIASLNLTYPFMKRTELPVEELQSDGNWSADCLTSSVLPTVNNKGIALTVDDDDDISEEIRSQRLQSVKRDVDAYLQFMRRGGSIHNGTEGLQVDSIVAVANDERKSSAPWFGRVLDIKEAEKLVVVK